MEVLRAIETDWNPRLLVGWETADDAGVYLLDGSTALVQTVDFFTPVVDEPFVYGAVAAANALSDVYAMGGRPITALAVCGFPSGELEIDVLGEIFRGGLSKMREAGVVLLGGHTVRDAELKFGYAVTGTVNPDRLWRNSGAQSGDWLVLTKPLGTGIISTGVKLGRTPAEVLQTAVDCMLQLNRDWVTFLAAREVHAATDVTGFGLLGHAYELAEASGVSLEIDPLKVPLLPGVTELIRERLLPGGIKANRQWIDQKVDWTCLDESQAIAFLDPQTSGGLLLSVPKSVAEAIQKQNKQAAVIGRVRGKQDYSIRFTPGSIIQG